MKKLIWLCVVCQITFGMESSGRIIGSPLNEFDKKRLSAIGHETPVAEREIVAVNTNGKWVYGWVQSKPDMSSGIWLGIVNWFSPINDTFRGQARNFQHSVKKLPALQRQ